jgi:hypothetical protein
MQDFRNPTTIYEFTPLVPQICRLDQNPDFQLVQTPTALYPGVCKIRQLFQPWPNFVSSYDECVLGVAGRT